MQKIGMGRVKLSNNEVVAATFLWANNLQILASKTIERDGYSAEVVGFGESKLKSWNKAQQHLFKDMVIPKKIYEHRTDSPGEIGSKLIPHQIFPVDSLVDVSADSKGRGFSGVMKRWNFDGLGASHGVSKAHRKGGSTGQRTHPGRVFLGKKMPGRYGGKRVTVQSMKIVFAEEYNLLGKTGSLLACWGAVPGPNGGYCSVKAAVKAGAK